MPSQVACKIVREILQENFLQAKSNRACEVDSRHNRCLAKYHKKGFSL